MESEDVLKSDEINMRNRGLTATIVVFQHHDSCNSNRTRCPYYNAVAVDVPMFASLPWAIRGLKDKSIFSLPNVKIMSEREVIVHLE
jgi:hypothetical protein